MRGRTAFIDMAERRNRESGRRLIRGWENTSFFWERYRIADTRGPRRRLTAAVPRSANWQVKAAERSTSEFIFP